MALAITAFVSAGVFNRAVPDPSDAQLAVAWDGSGTDGVPKAEFAPLQPSEDWAEHLLIVEPPLLQKEKDDKNEHALLAAAWLPLSFVPVRVGSVGAVRDDTQPYPARVTAGTGLARGPPAV